MNNRDDDVLSLDRLAQPRVRAVGEESAAIVESTVRVESAVGTESVKVRKLPLWHKDSRGFWLAVCVVISACAGWLMVHFHVVQ